MWERLRKLNLMRLLQYLSLHFSIGLVLSLGCFVVFAKLADSVGEGEMLVHFDQALAANLHAAATFDSTRFFTFMTLIGVPGLLIMTVVIALYYVWRKERWKAYLWLLAYLGGEAINRLLKLIFARQRPIFENPIMIEQDYSFPSGHAMLSMIIVGLLAYTLVTQLKPMWARIVSFFACVLLIVLIGISRLYLGVHFFSDVVAGFAAGGIWLITCVIAMNRIGKRVEANKMQHTVET